MNLSMNNMNSHIRSCQAMNPLDFDAFVMLLGYKTIELDPEDVLIEALSKWDDKQTGLISEDKLIFLNQLWQSS